MKKRFSEEQIIAFLNDRADEVLNRPSADVGFWHRASFSGNAVFRSLSGRSGHVEFMSTRRVPRELLAEIP